MRLQRLTKPPVPWLGHHAATRMVLEAIQARGLGQVRPRLTRPEAHLIVACDFWAAAMHRNLFRHLAGSAFIRLRAAEESFAGIHASGARAAVRLARLRLRVAGTPAPLSGIAEQLETDLIALKEPVDDFIADYARQHVGLRSIAGLDIGA